MWKFLHDEGDTAVRRTTSMTAVVEHNGTDFSWSVYNSGNVQLYGYYHMIPAYAGTAATHSEAMDKADEHIDKGPPVTIRQAMFTLNGEDGDYDNPQQLHMDRMKAKLADLKRQKESALRGGFGTWLLEDIARDIGRQEQAIERAKRINPALV